MIETALILSILTLLAGWFLLIKMPSAIRKLILGQMLLSDIIATGLVYLGFGGGVYALLAAGFACLWISLGLLIGKKYCEYTKIKWRKVPLLAIPFPMPYLEHHAAELPPTGWYIRITRVISAIGRLIFGRKDKHVSHSEQNCRLNVH